MLSIAILPLLLVSLVVLFMVLGGVILLQIYLSKKESKWVGLILPIIFFLFSLIPFVRMAFANRLLIGDYVIKMFIVLIVCNVPTIIFLGIYFSCREKIDR